MQIVVIDPSLSSEFGVRRERSSPQIFEWANLVDDGAKAKFLQSAATDGLTQLIFLPQEVKELRKQGLLNAPAIDIVLNSKNMLDIVTGPEKNFSQEVKGKVKNIPAVNFFARHRGKGRIFLAGTVGTVPLTELSEFLKKYAH